MAASPTERTLQALRREGWRAAVVERWNPHARVRQDLWGVIDVIAVRKGETLGVQCTTAAHVQDRVAKLRASDAVIDLIRAGWLVQVWGWRKDRRGRLRCRKVELRLVKEGRT